jgi:uncharacterized membrane protein
MGLSIAIFCIAVILGFLAAVMAFLISYEEYRRHFLDKKQVWKTSFHAGVFTWVVFLVLGLLLAILLPLMV